MVQCAISKTEVVRPCFFLIGTINGDWYERMVPHYHFLKPSNYSFDMIFSREGFLSTMWLCLCSIWTKHFQVDGWEGLNRFRGLRGVLKWPRVTSLFETTLKVRFSASYQNVLYFKAKLREAFAIITKETFHLIFKILENRHLALIFQNESKFENSLVRRILCLKALKCS